jgi:hypothetical protein
MTDNQEAPFITVRELRSFETAVLERLERLSEKFDEAVQDQVRALVRRLDRQDNRLDKLETWRSRLTGALALLSFLAGLGVPFVMKATGS